MATITGLTAERMQEIIDSTIVDADVVADNLILTKDDGSTINAGNVRGAPGAAGSGVGKGSAFPGAPTEGDLFIRTDQSGDPMYKYVAGTWVSAGGGLNKVTSFPSSPQDGDVVVRTDMNGSPLYAYSTENGWEQQPRMGAVTVPYVQGNIASAVAIPNDVDTAVAFNLELQDTDNMHDMVSNTTRLTVRTPGRYLLSAYANWASNTGGNFRMIAYRINAPGFNNAEEFDRPNGRGGFPSENTMSRVLNLKAGDFIEIYVRHDIGAPLNLNALTADLLWLGGPGQTVDERGTASVRATQTAAQVIPNATDTLLTLDSEDFDTEGLHDLTVNNTRITIKTPGLYHVSAFLEFLPAAAGFRQLLVKLNGANSPLPISRAYPPNGSDDMYMQTAGVMKLAGGDYLEISSYQNSGGPLSTRASSCYISATLIGSAKTVTPFIRAYTGGASIPTGTNTAVAFEFETSDNDNIHDLAINNTRFVAKTAGVYTILAQAAWQGTGGGTQRYAFLQKNGSQVIGIERRNANSAGPATEVSALVELAVGDYVELLAFQDSGGAVLLNGSATDFTGTTFLSMAKIGAPNTPQAAVDAIENWKTVGIEAGSAYANGWAVRTIYPTLKFRKDRGLVQFASTTLAKGTAPAAGEVIFTLPPGYRPPQDVWALVPNHDGTNPFVAHITIGSNGNVTLNEAIGATRAQFLAIGPLSFPI